jgi:hypothetical protein
VAPNQRSAEGAKCRQTQCKPKDVVRNLRSDSTVAKRRIGASLSACAHEVQSVWLKEAVFIAVIGRLGEKYSGFAEITSNAGHVA